ncbi:unnamed protein product [Prunus armeniaca]|uniref:Uncharacterized protein n=1 Tax=Prunus armeniaca TaxID=36596 RepID=A0A6J5WQ94_PRUAR|nr:unnamed protein product [Prunus armeniaca]
MRDKCQGLGMRGANSAVFVGPSVRQVPLEEVCGASKPSVSTHPSFGKRGSLAKILRGLAAVIWEVLDLFIFGKVREVIKPSCLRQGW